MSEPRSILGRSCKSFADILERLIERIVLVCWLDYYTLLRIDLLSRNLLKELFDRVEFREESRTVAVEVKRAVGVVGPPLEV